MKGVAFVLIAVLALVLIAVFEAGSHPSKHYFACFVTRDFGGMTDFDLSTSGSMVHEVVCQDLK